MLPELAHVVLEAALRLLEHDNRTEPLLVDYQPE